MLLQVQHRDVHALIDADLKNMLHVAKFLAPFLPLDITPIVQENMKQIPLECDFLLEMHNMQECRQILIEGGYEDRVCVSLKSCNK